MSGVRRVAVIGGGVVGVATAFLLSLRNIEVTVFDRAHGVALGASFANGSLVTPSLCDPWNAPGIGRQILRSLGRENAPVLVRASVLPSLLGWGRVFLKHSSPARFAANLNKNVRLATYNLQVMHRLLEQHRLEYHRSTLGTLKIYRDRHDLEIGIAYASRLEALGLQSHILSVNDVARLEPALVPILDRLAGGIHFPSDESGDAYEFSRQLQQLALSRGVRFRFDTMIHRLAREGNRIRAAVTTDGSEISADLFVLAAGSESPKLARTADIHIPVRPAKGYSITLPATCHEPPCIPVIDDGLHAAVVPLGDRLRVAGTAEFAGNDLSLPRSRIENLTGLLRSIYPVHSDQLDFAQVRGWAGLRPMSADGVPILGDCGISNLLLNTGHGHMGWTTAMASGMMITDLVTGSRPELAMGEYSLERFGAHRYGQGAIRWAT